MFRERFCIYNLPTGPIKVEVAVPPEKGPISVDVPVPAPETLDKKKEEKVVGVEKDTGVGLIKLDTDNQLKDLKEKVKVTAAPEIGITYNSTIEPPNDAFKPVTSIGDWEIKSALSEGKINPNAWSPATPQDRLKMYNELKIVGVPVNTPYFVSVFNQLNKCSDPAFLDTKPVEQRPWYKDPSTYIDKIRTAGDSAFCSAWGAAKAFKDQAIAVAMSAPSNAINFARENREPVIDGFTNFAKNSYRDFGRAVKERDYGSMAAYGVAAYAIYRGLKWLWGKSEGSGKTIKTALFGIGLAYSAAYIGKRNGHPGLYDFLTLKSATDSTAKDSPMLKPLLKIVPQAGRSPADGGINETMFMRASQVKMPRLQELYKNSKGGFIDPKEFRDVFTEFNGVSGSSLEKDHDTNYLNTGKQLFLIAKYMNTAYDKTLHTEQKYHDKSLSEVLSESPYKYSNVATFVETLKPYANKA